MEIPRNDIITILSQLVSIPSVPSNKDELRKIIAWIKEYLSIPELLIEEYTHNNFPSLLIKPKDWQKTKLLLNAHVDVVPAKNEQFVLNVDGNKAYGRGVLDMKGGAAVMLLLIKELASEGKLSNDVALMVVTDEEIGGLNGTKYLLEEKDAKTEFFLAGEPTNLTICNRQKGVTWIKLEESGKRAHASKPWLGRNANLSLVENLVKFYSSNSLPKEEEWVTTYNLAILQGGDAVNVVPDKSEAIIDVRRIEKESTEDILKKVKIAFPNAKISLLENEPCMITDDNNEWLVKIQHILQDKFNTTINLTKETFASDGRFYSEKGIPSVNFGPSGEDMHGDNEFVDLESLETYYHYLREIIVG